MPLNPSKGNMYGFVTSTWNAVKGKCSHDCSYCYMKRFPQKPIHFDAAEMKTDLGKGNTIFVGSSTDLFAADVPDEWISMTLTHCRDYPQNIYLFQSKNPIRFKDYLGQYPPQSIFATTVETNRSAYLASVSKAPSPAQRLLRLLEMKNRGFKTMVTIEPIMDFDVEEFSKLLVAAEPNWIAIGADSNSRHSLQEPAPEKVEALLKILKDNAEIKVKPNLGRITK